MSNKKDFVVGLDIGSSAVKAVELKPVGKKSFRVTAVGIEPIPPDSIVDGAIIDGTAVADAIKRLSPTQPKTEPSCPNRLPPSSGRISTGRPSSGGNARMPVTRRRRPRS